MQPYYAIQLHFCWPNSASSISHPSNISSIDPLLHLLSLILSISSLGPVLHILLLILPTSVISAHSIAHPSNISSIGPLYRSSFQYQFSRALLPLHRLTFQHHFSRPTSASSIAHSFNQFSRPTSAHSIAHPSSTSFLSPLLQLNPPVAKVSNELFLTV